MGYFPFFMDIEGRKGVIVGGGPVAARKAEKLLAFGPRLSVIAARFGEELRGIARRYPISLLEKDYEAGDLEGAAFVIAATDDGVLNGEIADWCRARNTPVNVVDDREKCTFFFPALVKEGAADGGDFHGWEVPCGGSLFARESGTLPAGGDRRGHRSPGTASAGGG